MGQTSHVVTMKPEKARKLACELQDSVESSCILRAGLSKASGPLQVGLHLVLNLQLTHTTPCLQVVEVNQLVWLCL